MVLLDKTNEKHPVRRQRRMQKELKQSLLIKTSHLLTADATCLNQQNGADRTRVPVLLVRTSTTGAGTSSLPQHGDVDSRWFRLSSSLSHNRTKTVRHHEALTNRHDTLSDVFLGVNT